MTTSTALMALLKSCSQKQDLREGRRIHAVILKEKILRDNPFIGNALIDMYAKCGAMVNAQQVFDALPARNVVCWTSLIAAYARVGHGQKALHTFERLKCEAVSNDAVTLSCAVKACGIIGALEKGKQLHAEIVSESLLGEDVVLGNSLVDMYVKCGALTNAQELFDELPDRNVFSWTALVVGYCQHGQYEKVLAYFKRIQDEGLSPDAMTFSCVLKACGSLGAFGLGKQLHTQVSMEGLLENNSVLGTALVNMYITCGALEKAKEVFDAFGVRNMVTWTALIAGYCRYGHNEEAIFSFEQMQSEGFDPDLTSLGTILPACGSLGAIEKGFKVHAEILGQGSFGRNIVLGNALVDMYAKWGSVAKAQQVFDELPIQNVASWTALIAGYGQVGKHGVLFECVNKLIERGIEPDRVLFSIVLDSCGYCFSVDGGQTFYEMLGERYCVTPTLEHHVGLVGLFRSTDNLEKATAIALKMPFSNPFSVWSYLLGACQKLGNLKLGELAFRHAVHFHEQC